jgi:predicted nucleic acid-binding Zn ribbon protein
LALKERDSALRNRVNDCSGRLPFYLYLIGEKEKKMKRGYTDKSWKRVLDGLRRGNITQGKNTKVNFCLNCGLKIVNWQKFCSVACSSKYSSEKITKKKTVLFEKGKLSDEQARKFFRKITPEKICSICGLSEWMGKEIYLVVDHIDGDHTNNFPSNFRYVCCNCDAQLETYKSKNNGRGRPSRRP